MQHLPAEIIYKILQIVESYELAWLSQVCRSVNAQAVPLLYESLTVDLHDLYAQKDSLCRSQGPPPPCVNQLQGLARNTQGQCYYVRRLAVVNQSDFKTRNEIDTMTVLDERNGTQLFVNSLLEMAIRRMERLTEFEWLVIAYPSKEIFAALSEYNISSFTYRCPENNTYRQNSTTMDYPGEYNADLRTLSTENLTCLNLQNLGTNKAVDDAADLMFQLRKQLKSLKLDILRRFLPDIRREHHPFEGFEATADADYDQACQQDTLYPFNYRFALTNEPEPMTLEELEIYGASDAFDADNWLRAFDFHTIQKLTLSDGRFSFKTGAEKFWTYMRELKVSFKSLKTDCEVEELDLFLESFDGLESLFLCDLDKRWSRFSKRHMAGHFSSLKKFFYPANIHGFASLAYDPLKEIVSHCPFLEELGTYITEERGLEPWFKMFEDIPRLKRLYVTVAASEGYDSLNHQEFCKEFFSYFGPRNSAFFKRLEVLSYYCTLWEIVPTEFTDLERADMEDELSYEPLSEGELEALDSDEDCRETTMEVDSATSETTDEDQPQEADSDHYMWLEQPHCYTWERSLSGFSRMPIRTSWVHYRHDEMASTVYEFVKRWAVEFHQGLRAQPVIRDDWADESDVGFDGYASPYASSESTGE